jgi:hypothetical protein
MDMDNAASVLAGTILAGLAIVIGVIVIVLINNILHKYWKPVRIFTNDSFNFNPPQRFVTQDELNKVSPTFEKQEPK